VAMSPMGHNRLKRGVVENLSGRRHRGRSAGCLMVTCLAVLGVMGVSGRTAVASPPGLDASIVAPASATLQCAAGPASATPWSFTVSFQEAAPATLLGASLDRAPAGIGAPLPGLAGARLQPPWEIGDVLERGYPPREWAGTLGDLALLPLGEVKAGSSDVVRVTVGLLTARPGGYVVAGFTIWARADGHDVASAVRSGLVLDIGRNGGCTGALGGRKTDELLSYRAGLPAASRAVAPGAAGPATPLPQLIAARATKDECGTVPRTVCSRLMCEYLGYLSELYLVVDKGSAAGLRQLLPWLDPLGAEDARALVAVHGAHREAWPGLPRAASPRPRFRALPGAGVDELTDCPWPDPFLPGAVRRVTITLAFDQPAGTSRTWRMTEAWDTDGNGCS